MKSMLLAFALLFFTGCAKTIHEARAPRPDPNHAVAVADIAHPGQG